ncbi:uncharacterized protein BcabD6B2_28340 [Babesia caballi]|uniref:Uncharacterized protein n=1 Tax=Babesia caballi TaxID=5871 RepID=A0AAV4LTR5_BABCB|nr:hypothetical protein, conserved [Babesia caballi]
MGVPKKKLTEWPEDLKDVIDWLAAVGGGFGTTRLGTGKYSELSDALEQLARFAEVKTKVFGASKSLQGDVKDLASGLGYGFLGYAGQNGYNFDGTGIVSISGNYVSSYRDLQWEEDAKSEYVSIFLAASPFAFWSLSYLYWKCSGSNGWANAQLTTTNNSGLYHFMSSMGFTPSQFKSMKGSAVAGILDSGDFYSFNELKKAFSFGSTYYSSSYPMFIEKLENDPKNDAIGRPLACCNLISKYYCEYQTLQDGQGETMFSKIRNMLNALKSSCGHNSDIKSQITNFISTVMPEPLSSTKENAVPYPSPAGPVAGTLTTIGLGGGAAAAYIFNLGGAKTLVNGLLRIG